MFVHKIYIPRCLYASLVLLVLVLMPHYISAQRPDTSSVVVKKANIKDAVTLPNTLVKPSLDAKKISKKKVSVAPKPIVYKPHSPQKALLWSLLPGAGQIYNHQAWKIPIIYTALGVVGYFVYDNYTQMSAFKKEYLYRVNNPGSVQLEGYESYPDASIYNLYQSYNQNFQLMIIITAGVYALNLVDAFVFGHLFEFQVNDDLALSLTPSVINPYHTPALVPSLGFSIRF